MEKLNLIAEHLGVPINYAIRPWQVMKAVFGFRNAIAHNKSTDLRPIVGTVPLEQSETHSVSSMVQSEWEAFVSRQDPERARDDVQVIIMSLYKAGTALGFNTSSLFVKGSQSRSITTAI